MRTLFISFVFILFTILVGLVCDKVTDVTMTVSCGAIITTALLTLALNIFTDQNVYKFSLSFFFPTMGLIEYVISMFLIEEVENNAWFIVVMAMFVIQLAVFLGITCVKNQKQLIHKSNSINN